MGRFSFFHSNDIYVPARVSRTGETRTEVRITRCHGLGSGHPNERCCFYFERDYNTQTVRLRCSRCGHHGPYCQTEEAAAQAFSMEQVDNTVDNGS